MCKKGDIFKFESSGNRFKIVNIDHNDIVWYVWIDITRKERKGQSLPKYALETFLAQGTIQIVTEFDEDLFTL